MYINKKNIFRFGYCMLLVLLVGCNTRPSHVLSPEKMEEVLYDYHIARGLADQNKYEYRYKTPLYVQGAIEKNGITVAQFDSSLIWYTRHMDDLAKIYKKIAKRFEVEKSDLDSLVTQRFDFVFKSEPGDSVDIWPHDKLLRLTQNRLNNYFKFTINADDNFVEGDYYELSFRSSLLGQKPDSIHTLYPATAGIVVSLENGTNLVRYCSINKDSIYSIKLKPDATLKTSKIEGFFYNPPQVDDIENVLLIDSILLYKMHFLKQGAELQNQDSIVSDTSNMEGNDAKNKSLKLKDNLELED